MYENLLVPVDGSDGAAGILHHAAEIAQSSDAQVQLVHVADTTQDSVTVVEADVVDALVQRGEEIVDEAAKTMNTHGVAAGTDVVQGNPAPTIVEYADRYHHDLIVIPTHGREGLSRHLLGSVTEKVVRLSSVPVLASRMKSDEQLEYPYDDILIPTDGSPGASHAVDHGLSLASRLDATVHALSVVDDTLPGLDIGTTVTGEADEEQASAAVDDLISDAEERGLTDTVRHIEHGSPAEEILECIESNDIDAVVMGTTGRRGTDRILLGSVAEKTVRTAPVPVITV